MLRRCFHARRLRVSGSSCVPQFLGMTRRSTSPDVVSEEQSSMARIWPHHSTCSCPQVRKFAIYSLRWSCISLHRRAGARDSLGSLARLWSAPQHPKRPIGWPRQRQLVLKHPAATAQGDLVMLFDNTLGRSPASYNPERTQCSSMSIYRPVISAIVYRNCRSKLFNWNHKKQCYPLSRMGL